MENVLIEHISTLKRHFNFVHDGQKDHECDSCGNSFSKASDLKVHINSVHNGQKNYKCDSCVWKDIFYGKKFEEPHWCSS